LAQAVTVCAQVQLYEEMRMAKRKEKKGSILQPDGIKRLRARGKRKLDDDQRALVLALAEVEADRLSEEERTALDEMKAQVKEYDTEDLARAVEHMVSAEAAADRKMDWPELKKRKRHRSTSAKK
jgi:hypothetical protein